MPVYRQAARVLATVAVLAAAGHSATLAQGDTIRVERAVIDSLRQLGRPLVYDRVFAWVEQVNVVDMIPQAQSGDTGQDSEPNIAVDPSNPNEIVGSAFTQNPTGATNLAPVFVSTDRGNTWALRNIVPSGNGMTGDISVAFARRDQTLYAGILRGGSAFRQMILRTDDPFAGGTMTTLVDHNANTYDQPYVSATTATVAGANRDRVYVGFNDLDEWSGAGGSGQTASSEFSLDARTAAAPAGFGIAGIEARTTAAQDMPAVRFAIHEDGVIYGVFYRWDSGNTPNAVCDVVVVRDDGFAAGATPFTALTDASDGLAGRLVVTGRTVPAFGAGGTFLGQNRLVASNLSIAVHPNNAGIVWIAYADRVGTTDYTLHVRRSTDSGTTWSGDLVTVTNATNPALAINSSGVLGFLYQQLTGTAPNQRWETHLRRTTTGVGWSDLLLADTPDNTPPPAGFQPYIGDYVDLVTVGRSFYGVFSASNVPDLNNFPQGVTYQRNADFTTNQLRDVTNTANVDVSIDPFFFRVTPPTIFHLCEYRPDLCRIVELAPGLIEIDVIENVPTLVVDPIPRNCLLKWSCPGCEGGGALCPPYYHIFIEDLDPEVWTVQLFGRNGEIVKHRVNQHENGIVLSFRPRRDNFREGEIGDYAIGFQSIGRVTGGRHVFPTRLEVSDFPFREHMKRRGGARTPQ
jgi:hypothetical protein